MSTIKDCPIYFNCFSSIILKYIDVAIERIEREEKSGETTGREPSILEKLLKVDRQVAIVMALDSLMAGVDTVRFFHYPK